MNVSWCNPATTATNPPTYPRAARIVRPGARPGGVLEFCDVVMCFDERRSFPNRYDEN